MTFNGTISPDAVRYRIVEDLAKLSGDFLVLTDAGEHAFKIDGKSLLETDLIRLEDREGRTLCQSSVHLARSKDALDLIDHTGVAIGSVQRHPVTPLRDRFSIELGEGPALFTEGNIPSLEFWIVGQSGATAEISRRWFRTRNSYGVAIAPGQQDAALLAATITIVHMSRGAT